MEEGSKIARINQPDLSSSEEEKRGQGRRGFFFGIFGRLKARYENWRSSRIFRRETLRAIKAVLKEQRANGGALFALKPAPPIRALALKNGLNRFFLDAEGGCFTKGVVRDLARGEWPAIMAQLEEWERRGLLRILKKPEAIGDGEIFIEMLNLIDMESPIPGWPPLRGAAMPLTRSQQHALFLKYDRAEICECPEGFDWHAAYRRVAPLRKAIEGAFGGECFEQIPQDKSTYGELRVPLCISTRREEEAPRICLCTFGDMVAISNESALTPGALEKLIAIFAEQGFQYIAESIANEPYDGGRDVGSWPKTWWHRYFDYL